MNNPARGGANFTSILLPPQPINRGQRITRYMMENSDRMRCTDARMSTVSTLCTHVSGVHSGTIVNYIIWYMCVCNKGHLVLYQVHDDERFSQTTREVHGVHSGPSSSHFESFFSRRLFIVPTLSSTSPQLDWSRVKKGGIWHLSCTVSRVTHLK